MIQTASMVLRKAQPILTNAGIEDAASELRILMAAALGVDRVALTSRLSSTLTPVQVAAFEALVHRRAAREPIAQIIGYRAFWKHDFIVTRDVLDPRPDTETLIEQALLSASPKRILDLGTGSGCILLSLLAEWPNATGVGVDQSVEALLVAKQNAARLGVSERAALIESDWFSNVSGKFDLIVSNPPYLTAAEYAGSEAELTRWEPQAALEAGVDGLDAYRIIANEVADYLEPDGQFFLEIGAAQADAVSKLLKDAGLKGVTVSHDLNTKPRVISAKPPKQAAK